MFKQRAVTAAILSIMGTLVLWLLGKFLLDLVGGVWDLASCFFGAYVASLVFVQPGRTTFKENLWPSIGIVFGTFVAISIGHALEQIFVRHVSVDFEPVGKFIWAALITSWWLIPGSAWVISKANTFGTHLK